MIALSLLIGSALIGIGLTRKVFPFTNTAERVLWGTVLGSMLSAWAGYLISSILFDVSYLALLAVTVLTWAIAGLFFYQDLRQVRRTKILNLLRSDHKYLILLLLFFAPIFFYYFYVGMFHPKSDGLYLTSTSWYDMALHLAIATSFLHGENFPPVYTILPAEPLRYPFLPDFHAAMLMKLGLGIWPSFALTSFVMAIALVGIFYCFARRLTRSKLASIIATLLFFFNGGLGFLLFFGDWRQSNRPLVEFFWNMGEDYTDALSRGIKFTNLMTSGLIPQRAMLYGMPITFIVLTLLAIVWRNWFESEVEKQVASQSGEMIDVRSPALKRNTWRSDLPPQGGTTNSSSGCAATEKKPNNAKILFAAGSITGLLPLFHTHSYMAIGFISCVLFLIRPRLSWVAFWIPAVMLAIPQVLSLGSHVSSGSFLRFHFGWMSYIETNFLVFMLRNFGLPLLLIFPAYFVAPRFLRTFYLPFVLLFVFCFLFIISPNDFDNIKLIYYWHAATAVVLSVWLRRLTREPTLWFLVILIVACSTASGVFAVTRNAKFIHRIFSPEEIEAGNFARDSLPPKALFLSGQNHNQPVLCLAGKRIVLGYDFWITSHGYDRATYDRIKDDVMMMYSGGPDTQRLLEKYQVDFIYVDSYQRTELKANLEFFDKHYTAVFKNKEVAIYDARKFLD